MCGLIGFLSLNSKHYVEKKAFLRQGLYMSALRGTDSTGVALCGLKDNKYALYKRALASYDYLQTLNAERILSGCDNATVVLGHTRSKTYGPVEDDTAHPFHYDHITMIHNGTVDNYKGLIDCDVPTDSAHIAKSMAVNGAKQTLEKLIGAFCIVWYDANLQTFNVARNTERPIHWIHVPKWDGIAYASEWPILGSILDRLNIQTSGEFLYPEEFKIYSWPAKFGDKLEVTSVPFVEFKPKARGSPRDTDGVIKDSRTTQIDSGTISRIDPSQGRCSVPSSPKAIKKATARLSRCGIPYGSNWACEVLSFEAYPKNKGNIGSVLLKFRAKSLDTFVGLMHNIRITDYNLWQYRDWVLCRAVNVKTSEGVDIIIMEPGEGLRGVSNERSGQVLRGPNGHFFSKAAWAELVSDGCGGCGDPLVEADEKDILWTGMNNKTPICKGCKKEPHIANSLGFLINRSH